MPASHVQPVDVLLLETPFFSQTGGDEVRAYVQSKYNLALLALGSYLRARSNLTVRLVNMVKDRIDVDALIRDLRASPPRVIGVPLYSYNLGHSYRVIRRIKCEMPDVHVCVGGPHVGMYPRETIGLPGIDSIVEGDGEEPFLQVCRQVVERGALDEAHLPPGTTTKASLAAGRCAKPWSAADLDALPMPDLSLLGDHTRYRDFLSNRTMAILTTSRGCPYTCHYCSSQFSKYRSYSIERILEIMRHYEANGVEYIEFWDETFNPNKRRLDEFADALLAAGWRTPWAIRGSVVLHVPYETLVKLRRTGLRVMQFGVESAQPRLIEYLNKRVDPSTITAAFDNCHRAGIRTVANMMVNIPGQTRRELRADLDFVRRLRPTYVSVSVYNWAPGTTHYADALRAGVLDRDHWREFAASPDGEEPVIHAQTETPVDEVYRRRDRFVSSYYFNPGYIGRYLRTIEPRELMRGAAIAGMMLKSRLRAGLRAARNRLSPASEQPRTSLVTGLPELSHAVAT